MSPRSAVLAPSALFLLTVSVLFGCGDDGASTPSSTQAIWRNSPDAGFYNEPFPLETRRTSTGAPDVTNYPNPRRVRLLDAYTAAVAQRDGFSPLSTVWIPFDGPIDPAALPTPEASREDASPVFLVDIDPESPDRGSRTPIRCAVTTRADSFRAANLLQVQPVPGFNLAQRRLYAVVARTDLATMDPEKPLETSEQLASLLDDMAPTGELAPVHAAFAPLRAWLDSAGIADDEVAGATVFRTGDVRSRLERAVEAVRAMPAPEPSEPLEEILDEPDYCAYSSAWSAPQYQSGTPPFETDGELQLDAMGVPQRQRDERAPFVVVVPKSAMPSAGFPLLVYVNGTGGLSRQVVDRGTSTADEPATPGTGPAMHLARRGWGAAATAAPVTEERIGAGSQGGFALYAITNPIAMRDNFVQSVLEQVLFRKMIESLEIDTSECDGAMVDSAHYDVANVAMMGQSLGSYITGMTAAVNPGVRGAILTGSGGSWVEFPFGVRNPFDVAALLSSLLSSPTEPIDRFHPVVAIFQLAVDPSDNTHYVSGLLRRPIDGIDAPHVLVIEGDDDDNIGPGLQRAIVAALGVDLVGEDVGAEADRIESAIVLAGRQKRAAPVSANVMTPDGPRTGAVVRYLPDRDDNGHNVTFQLDGPPHQYGCFLETLYGGGVPVVVEPGRPTDPCE